MPYQTFQGPNNGIIKAWVDGVPVEPDALTQLRNVASLPFIHKWVAAMPDMHVGRGATVGTVIATKAAIVPATVGVDIGCGMCAVQTTLKASDLPVNLTPIRVAIEKVIPLGQDSHEKVPSNAKAEWNQMQRKYKEIIEKHPHIESKNEPMVQIGTLGGGNHFISLSIDESQNVWAMLHSGSRNIGNRIGSYFIDIAKKDMKRQQINLPDVDLAYLSEGSENYDDYWRALKWAQDYASANRRVMMENVIQAIKHTSILPDFKILDSAVNCHHNYVALEYHYGENVMITRKGAISATLDEMGIIPGSMGTKSYIVKGLGNPESFCSCSHGAGRAMSRTAAKKHFTLEDHIKATDGVECRKDYGVIDETPGAYKDLDSVMNAQKDLVKIEHSLKEILTVKG